MNITINQITNQQETVQITVLSKILAAKGHKRAGFKELSWNKSDLDKFLNDE